ncbi:Nuclear nucleic acid-binding protein C1D [Aphelenchoides bicaudatus]|nr:Nuclear nucleic acid-binding protein C1D [Aphelenchoides bicaudatus]
MTQIPTEIVSTLKQFTSDLKKIEESVADFVTITPEQLEALTPLERSRREITAASVIHSLYCMYTSTFGRDPEKEDMVGVEERKIKDVESRLSELEQRPNRPVLNKRIARSFIRNALSETASSVNSARSTKARDKSTVDLSNAQMNESSPEQEDAAEDNEHYELEEEENF